PPQPPSATHASHCAKVISYLLSRKGAAIVTRCWLSGPRKSSEVGEPMVNSPAGTTTSSGQSAQSLTALLAVCADGLHAASRTAAVALAIIVSRRIFIVLLSGVAGVLASQTVIRAVANMRESCQFSYERRIQS